MTQAYPKSHYSDFNAIQRSERRPSHGSLLSVDRGTPYLPYAGRESHQESRTYVLPTPIHDLEQDSDPGSSRKRTSVACGRCRRRKIKCIPGQPCQACRNAGVDPSQCLYHRVGTRDTFDLDTSVGGPSPMTPISPYSPASPASYSNHYSGVPTADDRSPAISTYSRSGYSLPAYNYESLDTPTSTASYAGEDSRSWTNGHRPSTTMGYYEQESPTAYDCPTPMSRVSSNAPEPLSPLNMSTLQSSLPLPFERRLPAPNLVGSLMTPDNSNPISSRLSSLCIGSSYNRDNGNGWSMDGSGSSGGERRQPSIQDLADASMMLPPVTRTLNSAVTPLTTTPQDSGPLSNGIYASSQSSDELTPISTPTSTTQQSYFPAGGTLPSLSAGMLPHANYTRYASNTDASTNRASYYNWTSSSGTAPIIASIETAQSNLPTTENSPATGSLQSGRYPPLHHPRPKILPSSSHAAKLEKHDRVQHKEGHRSSKSSTQSKTSSTSHGTTSQTKKGSHKPSKGSL